MLATDLTRFRQTTDGAAASLTKVQGVNHTGTFIARMFIARTFMLVEKLDWKGPLMLAILRSTRMKAPLFAITISVLSILNQHEARGDVVYAAVTDGSLHAVATFDQNLDLTQQFTLPGPITGVAAGSGGDFYTAVGNTIDEYDAAGMQINSVSGSSTTTVPALSFSAPVVVTAVPEPGSIILLATGVVASWRSRRRSSPQRSSAAMV